MRFHQFLTAVLLGCAASASSAAETSPEFVPQWAKSAVWYQIFPERFRNGDPSNDPTVADIAGADPMDPPKQWRVHPWGSDWYQLQDYEKANGEPELWKHMQRRRYGGDLQGVIDKLDYLQDLGINAIYLNPVFDAPSNHKYDGASYHHIDPNFGPDPKGDRALMAKENPGDPKTWVWTKADELALKLIAEAHRRGIRVIFDGVFNHMGFNSFALQDVRRNKMKSPYLSWFTIKNFDDPASGVQFDYEGWWGNKSLPELREDANGIVAGPKAYIFAATQRWMNPKGQGTQHGIDGWRLDVAYMVAHPFWKDWRRHVKAINPEAYLTAEIVNTPEVVKPYLQGDEFDAEMHYNFAFTAAEFLFNEGKYRISAREFDRKLAELRTLYPPGVAYVNQNLFGSHDTNRIGSYIVNRGLGNFRDWGKWFQMSQPINNPAFSVRKPNAAELQLQKLFVVLQMTYVGAPMVYYGDEVGMWGGNDPDDRKPMIWPDIVYEKERALPKQDLRPESEADTVVQNADLHAFYKKLIGIRNAHPALRTGSYKTLLADNGDEVFAYERQSGDEVLWVILNNSEREQTVRLPRAGFDEFEDLLNGRTYAGQRAEMEFSVSAKQAAVLRAVRVPLNGSAPGR
ncbi:glycoside hydrolase family 13 protein [Arenimonas sp. GDDSR-1]|uniref:glycoside hydrolase family 13 protein n=1 Tax=Arenimonas sp. GDDSR-1 TaxID=2950125 RepID=UPI0026076B82|nr:glycoside hydrolase family 13 protein [Arenimonas sp. GDDSR-1]